MYAEYAKDPRMKLNVGIRRRLFPLLDNDRRMAELFHALLFSLPGSPILYYGDEIGMGDNIYLGDRDGVRTPMQWTPDRNAGFSKADFGQLYLPPLMDPVYGYQASTSRPSCATSRRSCTGCSACSRCAGSTRCSAPAASRSSRRRTRRCWPTCAPARMRTTTLVLCVNNLTRFAQPCELHARPVRGQEPHRAARPGAVPPDRRAALLHHARRPTASTGSSSWTRRPRGWARSPTDGSSHDHHRRDPAAAGQPPGRAALVRPRRPARAGRGRRLRALDGGRPGPVVAARRRPPGRPRPRSLPAGARRTPRR